MTVLSIFIGNSPEKVLIIDALQRISISPGDSEEIIAHTEGHGVPLGILQLIRFIQQVDVVVG